MQCFQDLCRVLMILAMSAPTFTNTVKTSGAANCKEAGWTSCCKMGECYVPDKNCFCDFSCHVFGDCCSDIDATCPQTPTNHACVAGDIHLIRDVSNGIEFCINGSFTRVCSIEDSTFKALLHGGIFKRQSSQDGSGSGTGNIVEVGFVEDNYTVSESESKVMVCVEVKSGFLTPAESAFVTISTSPGTARAEVDYEPVEESLLFDGSTFEDMVCIEISIIDDVFSEPTEQFSVSLINSGPNVILNQDTSTSLIYIKSTLTLPNDSCTEAGYDRQCCEGSVDQCLSPSSSCSCDTSCFQREDCCEDIFMYVVELMVRDVFIDEDEETTTVCAVVTGRYDNMDENITVTLNFTDSQLAVAGDDYQYYNSELEFPTMQQQLLPGEDLIQCINIDIIDDSRVEGEHVFTVEIASVSPASVIQCFIQSTTFHIEDNDVALVALLPLPETIPEEEPLRVYAMLSGVEYTDIPFTVNFTISNEQDTIVTSQIMFPVGQVANSSETNTSSGLVVCNTTSVDNDILDWSWKLTIELDIAHHDQLDFLSSLSFTTVIDDEAKLPSVHFQSADVSVTEGHRTVLCVVLDGIPAGGMSNDLAVSFTLTNSTAVLGDDFSLQGSTNTASITLVFRRGRNRTSVETTQCALIDAHEIAECRTDVYFSMTITSTSPPVTLQQPLTSTVSIRESNTTCLCPIAETTSDDNRESLYFNLLIVAAALVVFLTCVLLIALVLLCHYCRRHRHMHKDTEAEGTTIPNHIAYNSNTYDGNTNSVFPIIPVTNNSSSDPTNSDTRKTIAARNDIVGSLVIAHDYCDVDEPDDLEVGTRSKDSITQINKPSDLTELGATSKDYEDPVPSTEVNPSSDLTKSGTMSKDQVPGAHVNTHSVLTRSGEDYEDPVPSVHVNKPAAGVTELELGAMSKDYEEPVPSTSKPYKQTFV